jgi:hypothetical protein
MKRRSGTRKSRAVEIDGSKCVPFLWTRFSSRLTTKSGGTKFYRDLIVNNFVSCSIAGPTTHRDVILEIAKRSHKAIPIKSLPNNSNALPRGYVAHGFPGNYFDQLARSYQGMYWWMSDRGLNMQVFKSMSSNISPFDELAGQLVHEAWLLRLPNGRISPTEYEKLCTAIDKAAFKPLDYLNGKFRKQLADWNQKNPTKAIHTFCRLFNSKLTLARRGMLRRLNRAKFVWIKHSKLSAI